MNDTPTPRAKIIKDNIYIAMRADNNEQSIAHLEEAHREIENMERELSAVTEQLNEAQNEIVRLNRILAQGGGDLLAISHKSVTEQRDKLQSDLDEYAEDKSRLATMAMDFREQRDRLAKALEEVLKPEWSTDNTAELERIGSIARQALQSLNTQNETT